MTEKTKKSMSRHVAIGIGRLQGGGAERQALYLAEQLVNTGWKVSILYVVKKMSDPAVDPRIQLVFLERESTKNWFQVFRKCDEWIRRERPDLVHVWLPEVISVPLSKAASRHGIPCVSSIRRATFKGVRGINIVRDALGLVAHSFSDMVVSNFALDQEPALVKWVIRNKPKAVIPNGIDEKQQGHGKPAKAPPLRLLFVGRFVVQKRLSFLLRVLSGLKREVRLDVYGEGTSGAEQQLRELVQELSLESCVVFHGFDPNWRSYCGEIHIMVSPSVSEGMSNAILEAMAEGLPVVTTNIPEMLAVNIPFETGWTFDCDDAVALTDILESISFDEICRRGRLAREHAQSYSLVCMRDHYIKIYESLI